MGAATSGLVDCVVDGDIQRLKTILHEHEPKDDQAGGSAATTDSAWALELEEAVHTVVASELESGQQLQQLQIALELLLQARPEVWSSTASSVDHNDNTEDGADTSATSNPAGWSACHRACATGNLAFVVFVLHHYPAQFELQTRDAFGLFPIDLVPPELLMSAEEMADYFESQHDSDKPATARSRRCLALYQLRERKAALQDEQIRALLAKYNGADYSSNQDEELRGFYVSFEPNREHLAIDQARNMGNVHERGALLRVNYRLPRAEPFLNGYFQLIWRGIGDARSEEPNYDSRVTRFRDECSQILDDEATVQPLQSEESQGTTSQPEEEQHRALDDPHKSRVVEGFFPVDVTKLPSDSVCHVLFIACDKHMLRRTIALSTEGLAIQIQDLDSDDYYSDSTSDEELTPEPKQSEVQDPGYTFFVGGEEFSHPNPVFAGQSFPDVLTFESFIRELRVKKQRRLQEQHEESFDEEAAVKPDQGQQQEAGQEAGEMESKGDAVETPKQDEEEIRLPEAPALDTNAEQDPKRDETSE